MRTATLSFLALLTATQALPAAAPPGPETRPAGQRPEPAAQAPTAEQLLDRYDKSMAALRNSRITLVKRGKTEYSWKEPHWTYKEYTTDRDERGRMKLTWRRRG